MRGLEIVTCPPEFRQLLQIEGAIAARLEGGIIQWTSVARERGDRPWANTTP
jgi:hypothetical protein